MAVLTVLRGLTIGAQPVAAAAPKPGDDCAPNDNNPAVLSAARCVAEAIRNTRSALQAACLLDPKARSTANPLYQPTECRLGSGTQAEGIAQARYVAQMNAQSLDGDPPAIGGITPNAQWEVTYPKLFSSTGTAQRMDYIAYNRGAPGPIGIVELKQDNAPGQEVLAKNQVDRYVSDAPAGGGNRLKIPKNVDGYGDLYRVLRQDCKANGSVAERIVTQYTTRPGIRGDGVLMIDPDDERTKCPGQGEPKLPPVAVEEPKDEAVPDEDVEPRPPVVLPYPGRDDDGNNLDDLWEQFKKDHSWIGDIPIPEPADEPVLTGREILVGAAVVAAVVAAALLCVAVCGPAIGAGGAFLSSMGAALALETGSITVGTAIVGALAALVGLFGLNLWGDPHMVTFDRLQYDLQSVGEFHLLEMPEADIDVQGRFREVGVDVSVLDRVATRIEGRTVEFSGSSATLDGATLDLPVGGIQEIGGEGAFLARSNKGYVLVWPDNVGRPLAMTLQGSNVSFALPPPELSGPVKGLLGNHDGDTKNDLTLRDGTPLGANPGPATMHGSFADSWRLSDDESAFTYGQNQSTATFTDRSFPQNLVTTGDFPESMVAAATTTCSEAGVQAGPQFEGCVLDLLVTGDDAYAASAALVDDVVVGPNGLDFDANGRVGVDFEGTVPPNFSSARYSADPATSRVAGPIFDKGGYRFYLRNVGRHDGVVLETDIYAYGPVGQDDQPQSLALKVNSATLGSVLFDGGSPQLSNGMSGTLTQTGSGVTAGGKAFSRYRLSAPLGRLGESIDAEFVPSNFDGVFNTSLGFDNIALALTVPAAQHFEAAEPFATTGAGGSGALETPGAADAYDFDITSDSANRVHVVSTFNCTTPLTVAATNRDTGTPVVRWANTCTRLFTPALPAGRYTVTATPYASAAAGTYSLQLFVRPDPQVFDYSVGVVARTDVPAAGAGSIETVASKDVYAFQTVGGDLYFDHRACFGGEEWTLTARNGSAVLARGGCADRPLTGLSAGDYDLAFTTTSSQGGAYSFQLFGTPVAAQDFSVALPLTVSDQVPGSGSGNVENIRSVDRYTFSLPAAAPLYLDMQSCLDTGSLAWQLVRVDSGATVDSGACTDKQTTSLPTGTYRLDISSSSAGIGAYAFQAWLVPMPPQTFGISVPFVIAPELPATGAGNLETKASQDVYSFSLPSGKSALYVDQITCSKPNLLTWRLINDVNGRAVTVANGTCEDRQVRQVARGDYRLVVSAVGEAHGTYSLRIVPSDTGSPTILHAPATTAYYGQPIPVDVSTSCTDPATCFARVHYRTTSHTNTAGIADLAAGSWTTLDMTATGTTTVGSASLTAWKASIPGTAVTTTGVDYYVTAGDGDNRNELPSAPTAPGGVTGVPTGQGASVGERPYLHVTTVSPPLLSHVTPGYDQADTDMPLELKASCSTGNCTATLHYRTSAGLAPGTSELTGEPGWPKVTMTQTAATALTDVGNLLTFKASVPASYVDTRGVDYYFVVTDTQTTSYWPGTTYQGYYAPRDGMRTGYQTVHVLEPPHIVHAPVMTAPYRAATPITATANCPATRACTARLYYRTTTTSDDYVADGVLTAQDYTVVPMTVTRTISLIGNDIIGVSGGIPASVADTRGIDYFFRVDDGSTTAWFPGTGQVQGYVNIDGTRVAFQHIRVLEAPHIIPEPILAAKALQPYTVTSRLTCATENCSLTLHWRNDLAPGETDPGWHDIAMTRIGIPTPTAAGSLYTFSATIPGDKVTTRGLAYYLEAFDGYVHDYAPGTSYWGAYLPLDGRHVDAQPASVNGSKPVIGSFLVRVLEPPHLVHAPPGATEKGTPLTLTATSNCSSAACPAILTWTDRTGQARTVPMSAVRKVDDTGVNPAVPGDIWDYTATIPAEDTDTDVSYAMSITDGYTNDATPTLTALVYESP